jgi:integrase
MSGRRIALGIFEDAYGYELRWQDAGKPQTKRFPLDTPLATLKAKRATYAKQGRPSRPDDTGSFPRDAVRFLAGRKSLVSFKSDRSHLRPWIHRFKKVSRWAITSEHVRKALDEWRALGYKPRTLRHRLRILKQLCKTLDPESPNPCGGITIQKPAKTRPRRVRDDLISAVAFQLRKQEIAGYLRDMKTRARFLVLATTGMRPTQLMRAETHDLDVAERLWTIQPAKGDNGGLMYLNDEMLVAAQLFIAADAWGVYDSRSFSKTLHRNGWPKGVRPYTVRHKVGQTLRARGADLGDIQDHLGHASPTTTREHYLEPDLARLKDTSERLAGRLDPEAMLRTCATRRHGRKPTLKENRPHSAQGSEQANDHGREPHTKKTA